MINKEEVKHIAKIARLGLTEKEIKKLQKELSSILDYFDSLKKVNVPRVEPTFHPAEHYFDMAQHGEFIEPFFREKMGTMREDKEKSQPPELLNKLTKAAPDKKKGYVKVKTIL